MSLSNTHYYNICDGPFDENGLCDRGWHLRRRRCIPEGAWESRRGLVVRKKRFQQGWKRWVSGPPKWVKQNWNRQLRAKYTTQLRRDPEDPVLFDGQKWLAGRYEYWA